MQKMRKMGSASLAITVSLLTVSNASAQNWTGPIWDFQSRTCHDSGTCDSGMSGGEQFVVCTATAPDLLAERILYALGALDMCYGYTFDRYAAFLRDVPQRQQYAVNYLNYGFDQPLLSAAAAQALEARDFPRMAELPGAPPVPGGNRYVAPRSTGEVRTTHDRKRVTVNRPDGVECSNGKGSSVRWGGVDWNLNECDAEASQVGSSVPEGSMTGACGLPYMNAAQQQEQAIHARYGTCNEVGGTQVADADRTPSPARLATPDFADGARVGACGIPYVDDYGKEEQVMVADEGDCDEYVAEIEAEGY